MTEAQASMPDHIIIFTTPAAKMLAYVSSTIFWGYEGGLKWWSVHLQPKFDAKSSLTLA